MDHSLAISMFFFLVLSALLLHACAAPSPVLVSRGRCSLYLIQYPGAVALHGFRDLGPPPPPPPPPRPPQVGSPAGRTLYCKWEARQAGHFTAM
eukprot:7892587-Pyramimonas_sp.AAC.1